jgi:hypothetical protein
VGTGRALREAGYGYNAITKKPFDFPRALAPLAGTEPVPFLKEVGEKATDTTPFYFECSFKELIVEFVFGNNRWNDASSAQKKNGAINKMRRQKDKLSSFSLLSKYGR